MSALLLGGPYARADVTLVFAGGALVSRPYVELTLDMMRAFGEVALDRADGAGVQVDARTTPIRGGATRSSPTPRPPPTLSAPPPSPGAACASKASPQTRMQADFALLAILERMGCSVTRGRRTSSRYVGSAASLRGVDVDMNDLPDAVLALAVVAAFAAGETHIRNVANLRIKETDRLAALETELCKLGAECPRRRGLTAHRARPAASGRDRHVRRPPHGHGLRTGRACAYPAL